MNDEEKQPNERRNSCGMVSQVPTCSKYTTGWNCDSETIDLTSGNDNLHTNLSSNSNHILTNVTHNEEHVAQKTTDVHESEEHNKEQDVSSADNRRCNNCGRTLKNVTRLKNHQRRCPGYSSKDNHSQKGKNITNKNKEEEIMALKSNVNSNGQEINAKSVNTELKNESTLNISDNKPVSKPVSVERTPDIENAYKSVVKWRNNLFTLPKGKCGKHFIAEMTKQINCWCSKNDWRETSMKSLMIMPSLLLQKTSPKSNAKTIKEHLARRLDQWGKGDVAKLLQECESLQNRLPKPTNQQKDIAETAKNFKNYMIKGNVNAALRLLSENSNTGILPIDDDTIEKLYEKHPPAEPLHHGLLMHGEIRYVDPVIFYSINAGLIQKIAMRTKGAAHPSMLSADDWRNMLVSKQYGAEGIDLYKSIARLARQLCVDKVNDPDSIAALMSCRLISLDKNLGLRPIGIGILTSG